MACHTGQDLPSAGRFRITPDSAYWAKCRILHFAHHLRELAGIAELTGQAWPTQLAEFLVEMHVEVQVAKAGGRTKLTARRLAVFGKRCDSLIAEGKKLNPPPPRTGKRGRPALGPAGSLLVRLATHRADVLRFATNFTVPFDNYAEVLVMPMSA